MCEKDGSGFKDFLAKRNAKVSTYGVVETSDTMRRIEYLERFENMLAKHRLREMTGQEDTKMVMYVIDMLHGIREIDVNLVGVPDDSDSVSLDDIKKVETIEKSLKEEGDEGGILNSLSGGSDDVLHPFHSTMPKLANLLEGDKRVIGVIKGIIDSKELLNALEVFCDGIVDSSTMYEHNSVVCIITHDNNLLPSSITNNSFLIRPEPSTRSEREDILKEVIEYNKSMYIQKGYEAPVILNKDKEEYLAVSDGLSLNDWQALLLESLGKNKNKKIKFADIVQGKTNIVNNLRGVRIKNLDDAKGFEAIGGYNEIKQYLQSKIVNIYKNFKLAKRMNVDTPRGILLFGPPGTGKTYLSQQLAKALDCVFIEIMFEQLKSKWVGESEGNLNELLQRIDAMGDKVVVFVDEIDSLGKRGSGNNKVHDSMFSRLLKWLSEPERQAIILGATNTPEKIDKAFVRDGRFESQIYMGLPNHEARKEIFDIKFKEAGVKMGDEVNIDELAERTKYYTGANIEGVVKEAQMVAFNRLVDGDGKKIITNEDVQKAMFNKNKDVSDMEELDKSFRKYAEKNCDDKKLIVSVGDEKNKKEVKRSGRLS